MMRVVHLLWGAVFCLCGAWRYAEAADTPAEKKDQAPIVIEHLTAQSEVSFNLDTGIGTGTNGVLVRYLGAVLTANFAQVNDQTGDVLAQGDVHLQQENQIWRGDRLEYNFRTGQIKSDRFKTGVAPFFASGEGLTADLSNRVYTATNVTVTTDDVEKPFYKIRARQIQMVPGQYIQARDAVLYLGTVPIMYYPYYHRSLVRHPNNFAFTPGYRTLYGPFLLSAYNWQWNEKLNGTIHVDYRLKRGLGAGPEAHYDLGRWGRGEADAYFTHDDKPGVDSAGNAIRDDRHRIRFSHQATLRTNLTAKIAVREQSDAQVIRDFFEGEYRKDTQPKSFLEVNQLWPNFSLNVLAQTQINDFFQTVERLPDIRLSAIRQQLGISPFYYEGENSVGYFRFQPGSSAGTNFAAFRGDSFHQLLLPHTFGDWLNVRPRVGGRFTHYGETEGPGSTFDERGRFVFNTGLEVSAKASRVWRSPRSKFWDVNELRHIIQPTVNYVFVPSPNHDPTELPQFDTELPSLRLIPIEFPDYNQIDSIDSQNVLRFGLRNKLQTKRKQGIDNLLHWALFMDWRIHPRPDQETFTDLYSDIDLRPRSWLTLTSETRYDIGDNDWRLANHALTIEPNTTWSWSFGHRYYKPDANTVARFFRFDPAFGPDAENNIFHSTWYYRLNENWGARISHHFEARDGTLEEQQYTIYRDLRSWTAALSVRFRDNRFGQDDFTIAITFSLKAFPRYGLGTDRRNPSLLLGG